MSESHRELVAFAAVLDVGAILTFVAGYGARDGALVSIGGGLAVASVLLIAAAWFVGPYRWDAPQPWEVGR